MPGIERYAAKLAKDPKSRAFAQLADAYRKEGFLDEAIEICLRGLQEHPTYVSAHVVLGRAYLDKGAIEQAEAEFLKVVELDPENLLAHRLLGDIYARQERVAEARERYLTVSSLNPLDREVKALLAALPQPTVVTPRPSQPAPPPEELAPIPLPSGVEEPSGTAEVFVTETLADLYAQQGFLEQAAEIYRRLLKEDPSKLHLQRKLEDLARLQEGSSMAQELTAPPQPEPSPKDRTRENVLAVLEGWLRGIERRRASRRGEEL